MKMILKEDGKPGDKVAPVGSLGSWVLGHSLSGLAKFSTQLTEKGFITNKQSTSKKSQRTTQLNPVLVLPGQGHQLRYPFSTINFITFRTIYYLLPSVLTV